MTEALTIRSSYLIRERGQMMAALYRLKAVHPGSSVWTRTNQSLINEWRAHNLLHDLGLFRSHTADVDFEAPQNWCLGALYAILSLFYIP